MTYASSADRATTQLDPDNPWPGLDSFEEHAQDYFHGRDAEAEDLLRRVVDAPLTMLFGKSGLGKTSLLKAGLFPRLRQRHFLPVHVRLDVRPGAGSLIDQIREALRKEIEEQQVDATSPDEGETLWEYLHRSTLELWSTQNYPLTPVLVLDQFEEVFTLGERLPGEVERFKSDLGDLAENRIPATVAARLADEATAQRLDLRGMQYKVILTLREDFLPYLEGWRPVMPSLGRVRLRLLPMRPEQALSAVYDTAPHLMDKPLARRIVEFVAAAQTARLDGVSAKEVEAGPGGEIEPALLSLFCRGLNERRKRQGKARFDEQLLEGVQQSIIADYYQSCVSAFPDSVSRFIESELITAKGFRNSFAKDDAVPIHLTEDQLKQLIDRRLLRVEERYGTERIELTHDVLTPAVLEHRNRRHAEDERAALARQEAARRQELEAQTRQQRQRVRALALVALICLAMAGFAAWQWQRAVSARQRAEGAEKDAITAQSAAETARNEAIEKGEQAARASRRAAIDSLAALSSAKEAQKAKGVAEQQARIAYARELAATTAPLIKASDQDEVAVLLGLRAMGATYSADGTVTREAEDALRRAVGGSVTSLAFPGHRSAIQGIAFNPTGTELVTCAADGTVRVWNSASGDESRRTDIDGCDRLAFGREGIRLVHRDFSGLQTVVRDIPSGRSVLDIRRSRGSQIGSFSLSADGRRFAAHDNAGQLTVWELGSDGGAARQLMQMPVGRFATAMSADGNRAAAVAEDMVHVLDVREPDRPLRSIPAENVREIALSPDGLLLAIATGAAGVRVWNVSTGAASPVFAPGTSDDMTFSFPDGRYLATIGEKVITVWDTTTGKALQTLEGRAPVAFSADGARIAIASDATAATIWDIKSGNRVTTLYGSGESPMRAVAVSTNARHVVTSSGDGRVRVWDATSGRPTLTVLEEAPIELVALTSAGDRVAAWGQDRLTLWQSAPGGARSVPASERGLQVFDMSFTGGGRQLITAGPVREAFLMLWDVVSGRPSPASYAPKQPNFGRILAVSVSRDEQRIAVSTTTTGATVSDVASGRILLEIKDTWYEAVLAGPNGQWLAVSDQNRTEVWDVRLRKQVSPSGIPGIALNSPRRQTHLALRDDGRLLATVDTDQQTVTLWDAWTGVKASTLYRHGGKARAIAFTPDGMHLRVVADDWTVHDHPIRIPDLIALARTRVKRSLTSEECQKYLGTPQCPALE